MCTVAKGLAQMRVCIGLCANQEVRESAQDSQIMALNLIHAPAGTWGMQFGVGSSNLLVVVTYAW